MTVQRICARHGRHVDPDGCPKCRADRRQRPVKKTRAVVVRSSARWKKVVEQAKRRDGNRCTYGLERGDRGTRHYPDGRCPVTEGLDGHHRLPIEDGGAPYDLENVRTVCRTHHARLESDTRAKLSGRT